MVNKIGIIGDDRTFIGRVQQGFTYLIVIFLAIIFFQFLINDKDVLLLTRWFILLFGLRILFYFISFPLKIIGWLNVDAGGRIINISYKGNEYSIGDLYYLTIKIKDYRGKTKRLGPTFIVLPGTDNFISFRVDDIFVDRRLFVKNRKQFRLLKKSIYLLQTEDHSFKTLS